MIKKHYETYIIVDGNYEDTVIEEIISKYEAFFKKNEVDIKNIDRMGRRRMAYQIKKKQNGYYVCFEIISNPAVIAKLERTYKLDENIMRYLTVIMDKRTMNEKEEYFKKKAIIPEPVKEEIIEVPVENLNVVGDIAK